MHFPINYCNIWAVVRVDGGNRWTDEWMNDATKQVGIDKFQELAWNAKVIRVQLIYVWFSFSLRMNRNSFKLSKFAKNSKQIDSDIVLGAEKEGWRLRKFMLSPERRVESTRRACQKSQPHCWLSSIIRKKFHRLCFHFFSFDHMSESLLHGSMRMISHEYMRNISRLSNLGSERVADEWTIRATVDGWTLRAWIYWEWNEWGEGCVIDWIVLIIKSGRRVWVLCVDEMWFHEKLNIFNVLKKSNVSNHSNAEYPLKI